MHAVPAERLATANSAVDMPPVARAALPQIWIYPATAAIEPIVTVVNTLFPTKITLLKVVFKTGRSIDDSCKQLLTSSGPYSTVSKGAERRGTMLLLRIRPPLPVALSLGNVRPLAFEPERIVLEVTLISELTESKDKNLPVWMLLLLMVMLVVVCNPDRSRSVIFALDTLISELTESKDKNLQRDSLYVAATDGNAGCGLQSR